MRLLVMKYMFLACLAVALAAEMRPKRDLQFLKEVIAAKLGLTPPKPVQKEENVHILQIPNFDQFVVNNAVPKVTFVEVPTQQRIIQADPTTAIIGSYLGTKTQEETLIALQGMKQLIQMGVLGPRQEIVELAPPKSPVYVLSSPVVQQKLEYPEPRPMYPVFKEAVVPMSPPVISRMPALQSLPMPYVQSVSILPTPPERVIPTPPKYVIPEIRTVPIPPPVSVPLPQVMSLPTRYSYRQVNTDGSVASYLSEGREVIVTETNIPPPPPPAFIIKRLQKIIYGKHLGSPVPNATPTFGEVVVGPYYPESLLPIITEPSSVDVKVKHSDKNVTGSKINVAPTALPENTVTRRPLAVDIPVAPLVIPSPPIVTKVPTNENDDQDKYKHVHADGSISTHTGTLSNGESYEIVKSEDISKLPPPPPELLHRIETAAGKAHKPWRYSLKMSNGVGTYENLDGGKIYYSRLENPTNSDVLPDPLSSLNSEKPKSPNNNFFLVGNEDNELDEYGKPFLSTKINGENDATYQPNFEPIKKMPPLPMPIAGENEKNFHPQTIGAAKHSYKIVSNPADYHGFGSDGYSYTQVNHDGTVETFTGIEKLIRPVLFEEQTKQTHPLPAPVSVNLPPIIQHPTPTIINVGKGSGFSYTQINKEGSVKTISEGGKVNIPAPVLVAEAAPFHPIAVVDVIKQKSPCKTNKVCKNPVSSGFSYTQINNEGRATKITGDGQVIKPAFTEAIKAPLAPVAVIDVIQPHTQPQPVVVEVGDKNSPGAVIFQKPAVSNYIYRQISHTNPQPFTVVKVEDEPIVEVPVGDVHVKVNPHKHVRPDGTTYLCTEFHKIAPDAPIPPLPTDEVVATVPGDLIYVPPLNVNVPDPTSHKVVVKDSGSHISNIQVSSDSSTEVSITTEGSQPEETADITTNDEPLSFELNPIVVAPEGTKYSYSQKNLDGSSLKIKGDKDNTVSVTNVINGDSDPKSTDSVTVEDSDSTTDSTRGDIPAASS